MIRLISGRISRLEPRTTKQDCSMRKFLGTDLPKDQPSRTITKVMDENKELSQSMNFD